MHPAAPPTVTRKRRLLCTPQRLDFLRCGETTQGGYRPAASAVALALSSLAVMLLAACSGKPAESSQVVATVNKSEISVHQVNHVLQRQQGLPPEQAENARRQVLERLIEQEVAVQKALDLKLDRDPAVMQAITAARREVLARAYSAKVADTAAAPQAADVQAYYDARPALFAQRKVYALQEFAIQADPAQAEALTAFVTKAKSLREVTEYLRTQNLGVRVNQSSQPAENLPPALVDRLNAMKDGQLLLLAAPGGARIVVLAASRLAPVTLDQARSSIEQALVAERRQKAVQATLAAARQASDVQYFGAFAAAGPAPTTGAKSTSPASPTNPSATAPVASMAASTPVGAAAATAAADKLLNTASTIDAAAISKGLAGLK